MHDTKIRLCLVFNVFNFVYARVRALCIPHLFYFIFYYSLSKTELPEAHTHTNRIVVEIKKNVRFIQIKTHIFGLWFTVSFSFVFRSFFSLSRYKSYNKLTQFQSQHQSVVLVAFVFAFANCNAIYVCVCVCVRVCLRRTQLINDFSLYFVSCRKRNRV